MPSSPPRARVLKAGAGVFRAANSPEAVTGTRPAAAYKRAHRPVTKSSPTNSPYTFCQQKQPLEYTIAHLICTLGACAKPKK
jgi:hypothetical protein